jgi:bacillithiol system protein YtxJ
MRKLQTIKEWERVLEKSFGAPQIIFKYSNTCGSSLAALHRLKKYVAKETEVGENLFQVVVQHSRDVSGRIEHDLGIPHETPQIILIRNADAPYFVDHSDIDPERLGNEFRRNL